MALIILPVTTMRTDRALAARWSGRFRLTERGRALQEGARALHPEWVGHAFGEDSGAAKALQQRIVALRDKLVDSQG